MVGDWWDLNPSNKASIKVKNMGQGKGKEEWERWLKGKYATFTEKEALVDVRNLWRTKKKSWGSLRVHVWGGSHCIGGTLCHGRQKCVKLTGGDSYMQTDRQIYTHTHIHKIISSIPLLAMDHPDCGKQWLRHVPDKILPLWTSCKQETIGTSKFPHADMCLTTLTSTDPPQPYVYKVSHPTDCSFQPDAQRL